jgi:sec-independent protein translocase protein TatA
MFGLGPTELLIIAVIVLLIFGAKRLPEIGKGIGGAIREFKNVKKEASLDEPADKVKSDQASEDKQGNPSGIEAKVKTKLLEQVPGVKKAMDVKKKAEQVKKLIE